MEVAKQHIDTSARQIIFPDAGKGKGTSGRDVGMLRRGVPVRVRKKWKVLRNGIVIESVAQNAPPSLQKNQIVVTDMSQKWEICGLEWDHWIKKPTFKPKMSAASFVMRILIVAHMNGLPQLRYAT